MRWQLLVVAACWTGAESPPAATSSAPRPAFAVTLERTECFGRCPAYVVAIDDVGMVAWTGKANVVASAAGRQVSREQLAELDRAIDAAHFFELDKYGHPPARTTCRQVGNTTTCEFSSDTICSDTSHAIVTVQRGAKRHRVDDQQCGDVPAGLTVLEKLIDRIAGTRDWIGR